MDGMEEFARHIGKILDQQEGTEGLSEEDLSQLSPEALLRYLMLPPEAVEALSEVAGWAPRKDVENLKEISRQEEARHPEGNETPSMRAIAVLFNYPKVVYHYLGEAVFPLFFGKGLWNTLEALSCLAYWVGHRDGREGR